MNCMTCANWYREKPDHLGRVRKSGTCRDERNMVFFGVPEEKDPKPNMFNMTWEWDSCQHWMGRHD